MVNWLDKIRANQHTKYVVATFIILMFCFITTLGIFQQINSTDCKILVCVYKETINPIVNWVGIVLFLPLIILYAFGLKGQGYFLLGIILSMIWLFILSIILSVLYYYIKKMLGYVAHLSKYFKLFKSSTNLKKTAMPKSEIISLFSKYSVLSLIIFFIFIALTSFLNYNAQTALKISFEQYLTLAAFVMGFSAYLINLLKGKSDEIKLVKKGIISIGFAGVIILILGALMNWLNIARTVTETPQLYDLAALNAFEVAVVGTGLFSLIIMFYVFFLYNLPEKKKY